MINVGVRTTAPSRIMRICRAVTQHVFVNQFLKIHAHGAINADDLVGAYAGIGGHVSVGVMDADIRGIVADRMRDALSRGGDETG